MSRNSKRMSASEQTEADLPVQNVTAQNPETTASRTSTTEAVPLPSGGRFYPAGHPLHGQEFIEIRFMTARDEDILTSPSLLKQGVALDRLVQGLLVDQRIRVDDLLVGDKAAIMIAARITGYGPDYDVEITCPECSTESETTFDLSDYEKYYTVGDEIENFHLNQKGMFETTLPASGATVELRMVNSRDETRMVKAQQLKTKNKLADSTSTDFLKLIIHSIDGNSDRNAISQLVMDLPARDARFLRTNYSKVVPNVDLKEHFECPYCGTETEMEVPLEAGVFWPE